MVRISLIFLAVLFSGLAHAQQLPTDRFYDNETVNLDGLGADRQWREDQVRLPDGWSEDDLQEFSLDKNNSAFQLFMDTRQLEVGSDRVVRYILVLRSNSGASNAFYEGARCDEGVYRTYAYAGSDGALKPMRGNRWRSVGDDAYRLRAPLLKEIFCNQMGLVLNKDQIVQNLEGHDVKYEIGN
ncbi:MAG: CNP1-like family protein [Gammaproteobacteria bacterium]